MSHQMIYSDLFSDAIFHFSEIKILSVKMLKICSFQNDVNTIPLLPDIRLGAFEFFLIECFLIYMLINKSIGIRYN